MSSSLWDDNEDNDGQHGGYHHSRKHTKTNPAKEGVLCAELKGRKKSS